MIDTLTVIADTLASAPVNPDLAPILVGVNEPWYVTHYVELIFIVLAAVKAVMNLLPSTSAAPQIFGYVDVLIGMMFKDRRKK